MEREGVSENDSLGRGIQVIYIITLKLYEFELAFPELYRRYDLDMT